MGLYYVTPHYEFDLEELEPDCNTTWFIIADTVRNAAEFWIQKFKDFTDIEIKYKCSLTEQEIDDALELGEGRSKLFKKLVQIRDISFKQGVQSGAVDWESLPSTHFLISEV